jgi:hypothetical protein
MIHSTSALIALLTMPHKVRTVDLVNGLTPTAMEAR